MVQRGIRYRLRRSLVVLYRAWCRRHLRKFDEATKTPTKVQREILFRRIDHNRDSRFGRDHHFEEIRSVGDFRSHIPVSPYEYYESYIDDMKRGQIDALLGNDQKLVMFALTSGTQSARKFIPVTKEYVKLFRRGWLIWGVNAGKAHSGWLDGKIVQLASDWDEFRTEAGTPCGSVSGLVGKMQSKIVRRRYCIPPEVGQIKDVTARHYTTLRLAIPESATFVTTANPSTFVNLARLGDSERDSLVRDIHDGTLSERFEIPVAIRQYLRPLIKADPQRASELTKILDDTGRLLPKDYWPDLRFIGNWTGGAVGSYLRHYGELFGDTPVRDIGLVASEGRMTIPVESGTPAGVLDIMTNFYEFIPEEEIDTEHPTILEAHELEPDRNYFILLTTPSGFYRYNIYDVVRMVGKYNETPLLEFLNKGSHVASITGEKLSESQVSRAVSRALEDLSMTLTAFTLAPCWDDDLPYYSLLAEQRDVSNEGQAQAMLQRVDACLKELNPEYESKRDSKRLGPLRLGFLPDGSWQAFREDRLRNTGGSFEQYKHPCLVNDLKFVEQMPISGELTSDRSDAA